MLKQGSFSLNVELSKYANKSGLSKIYIRITLDRKFKRIPTSIFLKPEQFSNNAKFGKWVKKHPDSEIYNDIIEKEINNYKKRLLDKKENFDLGIEYILKESKETNYKNDFIQFLEHKINMQSNFNQQKGYNTTKNRHIIPFIENKYGIKKLSFNKITPTFLMDFENYLRSKNISINTIHTQIRRVRAIYNSAIAEGIISTNNYPFIGYKLPKIQPARKERLNEDEVNSIINLNLVKNSLIENVRQSWLLSYYCAGIRVEDLLTLKSSNISEGRINYQMNKTGNLKSIRISDKIAVILDYFKDQNRSSQFILPFLSDDILKLDKNGKEYNKQISSKTALLNKYLKEIAKLAGINKKLSNHIARHSFANNIRKKTNDIHAIKNALGHSSIKVTEMYLDSFDELKLDEVMDLI
jgi:integrase/recombinase XerD